MRKLEGATQQEQEAAIDELVSDLTLEEKVAMLSGHGFMKQIARGDQACLQGIRFDRTPTDKRDKARGWLVTRWGGITSSRHPTSLAQRSWLE